MSRARFLDSRIVARKVKYQYRFDPPQSPREEFTFEQLQYLNLLTGLAQKSEIDTAERA